MPAKMKPAPKLTSSPHQEGKTLNPLIRRFRRDLGSENRAPGTINLYVFHLTRIEGMLPVPLDQATTEHLRDALDQLSRRLKPGTVHVAVISLKRFFRWALEEEERTDNPAKNLKTPMVPMKDTQPPTDDEVDALLKVTKRDKTWRGLRDHAILRTLSYAGLRVSELTNANVEDFDADDCTIRVMGKGRKPRVCLVGDKAAGAIETYLLRGRKKPQRGDAPLFTGRDGSRFLPNGVSGMLESRGAQAQIERHLYPHILRHYAATRMAGAGLQESEMRHIMGWAPGSNMVLRYTQSTLAERARDAQRRAMDGRWG